MVQALDRVRGRAKRGERLKRVLHKSPVVGYQVFRYPAFTAAVVTACCSCLADRELYAGRAETRNRTRKDSCCMRLHKLIYIYLVVKVKTSNLCSVFCCVAVLALVCGLSRVHAAESELKDDAGKTIIKYVVETPEGMAAADTKDPANNSG